MRIGELKAQAKESLRERKLKAAGATFIYLLIAIIPTIVYEILKSTLDPTTTSLINIIISLVITSLMSVGLYRYFISFSDRNKDTKLSLLFSGTDSFFKVFLYQILIFVVIFVIAFISILLGVGIAIASKLNPVTIGILVLLGIALFVALMYFSLRISFTIIIFAEDKEAGVIAAIKTSFKLTKGHVWKIFLTGLSFILWVIFCILIIPILYVFPYAQLTFINLYYDLKNSQEESTSTLS